MDDYAVGYTAATITIVKSSLLKGRYYKVIAYASTFKSVIGTASYVFFTNCPPHTGSCTVNPRSGKCILLLHDGQLRLTVCLLLNFVFLANYRVGQKVSCCTAGCKYANYAPI